MPKSLRSWTAALFVVAFLVMFVRYSERAPKRHYSDFRVYYATAERFLAGGDIYRPEGDDITPFKYSPTFALLTSPLALVPEKTASLVFFTLNFSAFAAFFFLSLELASPRSRLAAGAFALVFSFRFVLGILDSGQVNLLMLALAVSGLYSMKKGRTVLGAALLALSVMIKYVTFIFLPWLLVRKKFKEAALVLAFVAVYTALPALFIGVERQKAYLDGWLPQITQTSLDRGSWTDYKNQSVYSLVIRTTMKDCPYRSGWPLLPFEQAKALGILAALALYLLMLVPHPREDADLALLFAGLALFNPNSWPFNFASLLFAAALVFDGLKEGGFKDRVSFALLGAAFLLGSCASESLVGDEWQRVLEIYSALAWGGLAMLAALFRLKFRR